MQTSSSFAFFFLHFFGSLFVHWAPPLGADDCVYGSVQNFWILPAESYSGSNLKLT